MSVTHSNISIFVTHLGCPNCCSFCNQRHIAGNYSLPDEIAVDSAVLSAQKSNKYNPKTTEIAFFGGSFTAIDKNYMISLLEAAHKHIKSGAVYGIRISTRPDAIDDEVLTILKNYGVTTIELGAQSMDDTVLSENMRGHTSKQVEDASKLIKSYGFSLGLQMMTGLYGSCDELDIATAEKIIALKPDCVRIYPTLTIKDTYLEKMYKDGRYKPQTLEEAVKLAKELLIMFENADINVIRVGLQTTDEINSGASVVAGPFHSSFRELVESEIYYDIISEQIKNHGGRGDIFVNPSEVSKATGNKKNNVKRIKENFNVDIKIKPDNKLNKREVRYVCC